MEPKIQEKVWDLKIESDIRKKWEDSKLYEFHPDTDGYTIDTPPHILPADHGISEPQHIILRLI